MKPIMNSEIFKVARGYASEMSTKLIGKAITAGAKIRNADRETLTKALKAGGVVAAGILIASKLFGLQIVLGLLGGTVMLSDLLSRIEDAEERAKVEAAFNALKASGSETTTESIVSKVESD